MEDKVLKLKRLINQESSIYKDNKNLLHVINEMKNSNPKNELILDLIEEKIIKNYNIYMFNNLLTVYRKYLDNINLNKINKKQIDFIFNDLKKRNLRPNTKRRYWKLIREVITFFKKNIDLSLYQINQENSYSRSSRFINFNVDELNGKSFNKKFDLLKSTIKVESTLYYTHQQFASALKRLYLCINKDNIKFLDFLIEKRFNGISQKRCQRFIIVYLKRLNEININSMVKEDILNIFVKIQNDDLELSTKKAEWIIVKNIVYFLDYEFNLDKYKIKGSKRTLKHSDLVNKEEMSLIFNSKMNLDKKVMIYILYSTGMRIGECFNLNRSCFNKIEEGYIIRIPSGKTGSRTVFTKDEFKFIEILLKESWQTWSFSYGMIRKVLKKYERKFNKRLYFHLMRHTKATELSTKINEQLLKQFMGWNAGSKMLNTYLHLNNKDAIDEIKKLSIEGLI